MKNSLFPILYFSLIIASGFTIRMAFAERSPSVENITEVSIEDNQLNAKNAHKGGFDFSKIDKSESMPTYTKRVPANIEIKVKPKNAAPPFSYAGPIIFLIALPIALWVFISKKLSKPEVVVTSLKLYKNESSLEIKETNEIQNQDKEKIEKFPKAS